jgi:hypothetical protein
MKSEPVSLRPQFDTEGGRCSRPIFLILWACATVFGLQLSALLWEYEPMLNSSHCCEGTNALSVAHRIGQTVQKSDFFDIATLLSGRRGLLK